MHVPEDGLSLLQLAKRLKVQPKRLLSYEYGSHFEVSFRRKGKRMVRFYPPALVEMLAKVVALIERGYGPKMAFYMAKRGETPPTNQATIALDQEGDTPCR